MAAKKEIVESLTLLLTSFPEWGKTLTSEEKQQTLALYGKRLEEFDNDVLKKAIVIILDTARFFPKIAEIREIVFSLSDPYYPTPLEAWDMVRGGNYSCQIAKEVYHPLEFGDSYAPRYKEIVSVNMRAFLRDYALRVEREKQNRRVPELDKTPTAPPQLETVVEDVYKEIKAVHKKETFEEFLRSME